MLLLVYLQLTSTLLVSSESLVDKILKIKTCGPPQIQNAMMNQTVRPGEQASFKCQIDMSCIVAFIEWYHDMTNGTSTKIKTARSGDPHTHIIQRVEPTHEGLYTCVAGNVLGKAEASAYLAVDSGSSSAFIRLEGGFLCLSLLQLLRSTLTRLPWG